MLQYRHAASFKEVPTCVLLNHQTECEESIEKILTAGVRKKALCGQKVPLALHLPLKGKEGASVTQERERERERERASEQLFTMRFIPTTHTSWYTRSLPSQSPASTFKLGSQSVEEFMNCIYSVFPILHDLLVHCIYLHTKN